MNTEPRIDALLPADMARRAEYIGVTKATAPVISVFSLAILTGAFIALGAIFAMTVSGEHGRGIALWRLMAAGRRRQHGFVGGAIISDSYGRVGKLRLR